MKTREEIEKLMPDLMACDGNWNGYWGAPLLYWGKEEPTPRQEAIMRQYGFIQYGQYTKYWVAERTMPELRIERLMDRLREPLCWEEPETNLERGKRLHEELLGDRAQRKERLKVELGAALGFGREEILTLDQTWDACRWLADKIIDMQEAQHGDPDAFVKCLEDNGKLRKENKRLQALDDMHKHEVEHLNARIKHLEGHVEVLKLERGPSAVEQAKPAQRGTTIYCQNDEEI
jgi:hypothetical protein